MRKIVLNTMLIGGLSLAPTLALASSAANSSYHRCVSQKQAVAKAYCDKAGVDCKAELSAARRECKSEVKEGLHFKQD